MHDPKSTKVSNGLESSSLQGKINNPGSVNFSGSLFWRKADPFLPTQDFPCTYPRWDCTCEHKLRPQKPEGLRFKSLNSSLISSSGRYGVSVPALHKRPRRKQDPIRRIQERPIRRIQAMEIKYSGRYRTCMRMEQYLTHFDYALWEVIVNSDAPAIASASTEGPVPPKTAEQKLARKNELKAKSTLLLAIPDEYLLKFHGIKDAKTL
ncbi:hypothetical protein Tco_0178417 [Tanacetum coccineum]